MTPCRRPLRWLAAALLLGVLATLAPQVALAHGGHAREAAAPVSDTQARDKSVAPTLENLRAWSEWRPCPDTPAHLCGCGNLVPCSGGNDSVSVLPAAFVTQHHLPHRATPAFSSRNPPLGALFLTSARSRAPPRFA